MELISSAFVINVFFGGVLAFSSKQIKNRFDILEGRIHDESQLRRDDFNMLFNKVDSMETMLRQFLENEANQGGTITTLIQDQTKQLDEKVEEVFASVVHAFNSEKKLNVRFRRRIPEMFVTIQSLKRHVDATDKNCAVILGDLSDELKQISKDIEFHANKSENILQEAEVKLAEKITNLEENQVKYVADIKKENKQLYKNLTMEIRNMKQNVETYDHELNNQYENITKGMNLIEDNQLRHLNELKTTSEDTSNIREKVDKYDTYMKGQYETLKKGINYIKDKQNKHLTELKTVTKELGNIGEKVENYDTELKSRYGNLSKGVSKLTENQAHHIGELKTDTKQNNEHRKTLLNKISNTEEKVADMIAVNKHQYEEISREINIIKESVFTGSSCLNYYNTGFREDGLYQILIEKTKTIEVYCDMTTDGGGWTVFQRRKDGSVDFYRKWNEYKTGFGNLLGEFWLGNDYLNLLTESDMAIELRIDLGDHEGNHAYAKYSHFKVGNESEKYKLTVHGYSGNAGDSLKPHNGRLFTTSDNDNDLNTEGNCAFDYHGAWWYKYCAKANLNGKYTNSSEECKKLKPQHPWNHCVLWRTWKGLLGPMTFTEMKLRPTQYH